MALACPGFVEFVERGEFDSEQVHVLATALLAPANEAKVDALLLGCTHYPYLARTLSDVMGRDVVLVSSADETAFEVRRLMVDRGLLRPDAAGTAAARPRSSPPATSTGSRSWAADCSAPSWSASRRRCVGPAAGDVVACTVLGSSGTYAGPDGACSGFLVRSAGDGRDDGRRTRARWPTSSATSLSSELDAVVLSHSHPDHWLELPVLRNALKYVAGRARASTCTPPPRPSGWPSSCAPAHARRRRSART